MYCFSSGWLCIPSPAVQTDWLHSNEWLRTRAGPEAPKNKRIPLVHFSVRPLAQQGCRKKCGIVSAVLTKTSGVILLDNAAPCVSWLTTYLKWRFNLSGTLKEKPALAVLLQFSLNILQLPQCNKLQTHAYNTHTLSIAVLLYRAMTSCLASEWYKIQYSEFNSTTLRPNRLK